MPKQKEFSIAETFAKKWFEIRFCASDPDKAHYVLKSRIALKSIGFFETDKGTFFKFKDGSVLHLTPKGSAEVEDDNC